MTDLSRRQTLALAPAAMLAASPAFAAPNAAATLDAIANDVLALSPTTATSLGLDTGPRAALRARLDDASPAAEARWTATARSILRRLDAIGPVPAQQRLAVDSVRFAAERAVRGAGLPLGSAAGGWFGGAVPYPVTQQDGAILSIPEFLHSQHPVKTRADAEAYIARLNALAVTLDQETAKMRRQAAQRIAPPAFILANARAQRAGFRAMPAASQKLVTSLAERTTAIPGDWTAMATRIIETRIYPALDRQIAAIDAAVPVANRAAGVGALPGGEAYYRWALSLGTTTAAAPREVHETGLRQNREIQARMDAILREQGMTQGTVGERLARLTADPSQLYPDTDAGREQLIAYCNDRVAALRGLLPKLSHMRLKAPLQVKRVPTDIQDGAALGYMNFASLDGSRPAIYYINLKSTSLWPKYQIPTLTAHEGVPGHAWQGAYLAEQRADVPLVLNTLNFTAFTEGWALYAEQLADEAGLYASDPLGRLGYLQAQQFRACRMVVDTGLHAFGWTRERAVAFLVAETGRGRDAMTSEVDRYCVSPGQATGYKTGHNEINRLRDSARAAMGQRFDGAAFNDAVIRAGNVPLPVLAQAIDRWRTGAA